MRKEQIMIDYIKGELVELTAAAAVIDCQGIGYSLNISLNTYSAIQGKNSCKLYVYEAVRQDFPTLLFGFSTKQERELFLLLISVSGIGGNTARMILSALSPNELVSVISNENANLLKSIKGIGLKTAQRIIVDLKDKINLNAASLGEGINIPTPLPGHSQVHDEAVSALTMLGFAPAPVHKAVSALLKEMPEATVEQIIKQALKRL